MCAFKTSLEGCTLTSKPEIDPSIPTQGTEQGTTVVERFKGLLGPGCRIGPFQICFIAVVVSRVKN